MLDKLLVSRIKVFTKLRIKANVFKGTKTEISSEVLKGKYLNIINDLRSESCSIRASDASVGDVSTELAVYNISCNPNYAFKISDDISSLSGELQAIKKAVDFNIEESLSTAAIFTDS